MLNEKRWICCRYIEWNLVAWKLHARLLKLSWNAEQEDQYIYSQSCWEAKWKNKGHDTLFPGKWNKEAIGLKTNKIPYFIPHWMALMEDLPSIAFYEESKLPLVLVTKQDPNIRSLLNSLFIQFYKRYSRSRCSASIVLTPLLSIFQNRNIRQLLIGRACSLYPNRRNCLASEMFDRSQL